MSDEMELKKHIESSLKWGRGIWETWNPKSHYYLYTDFFEDYSICFEIKNNLLELYVYGYSQGYKVTLTFDKKDVLKFILTLESIRWGEFGIGYKTVKDKSNDTLFYKIENSDFQNHYYKNFKDKLKNKNVNYLSTVTSDDVLDILFLEEPKVSFESFEPIIDEVEDENIGEIYRLEDIVLPFDNYKLESFRGERYYYVFELYGEHTNKRYRITLEYEAVESLMINNREYFNEEIFENVSDKKGIRIFDEIKDSKFVKWYQKQSVFGPGIILSHIRFKCCDDFVIDLLFRNWEIGVMEI